MNWDENEAPPSNVEESSASSAAMDSESPGQDHATFGRYRLLASLAQGGMANVYLGVALGPAGFNKLMVIKALREELVMHSEEFAPMFLDEARLSARLSHPNIVQTYEIGEVAGRYFLAMEYLEGQPMRVVQRRLGRVGLPLEEELRILAEAARGLHHAHELRGLRGEFLGVVHRDVSPQNIFLTYNGQVKVLDFGIAKARDAGHLTKAGLIKGKLDYIAPEQIRGDKLDRRADVFSLGAMLWEALTGQRFGGGSALSDVTKMHRRLTGAEPAAAELNADIPDTLAAIAERARALDPSDRFPTAEAFADELEHFLKTLGMHPSARSLSDRLGAPFALERVRINAQIEQQVRRAVESNQRLSTLPNLGRSERESSTAIRTGAFASTGTWRGSLPSLNHMAASRVAHTTGSLPPSPAAPSITPSALPHPRLGPAKVAAVCLALGVAAGAALLLHRDDAAPETHAASAPAIGHPSPVAASASRGESGPPHRPNQAAALRLQIQVVPAEAQATLDGSMLSTLPFFAELTRDGRLHHLEVSAPGHQSKRVLIPFDRHHDLTIVLDPLPVEAQRGWHRRRRSSEASLEDPTALDGLNTQQAVHDEILPGTKLPTLERVKATIDTDDPYAD